MLKLNEYGSKGADDLAHTGFVLYLYKVGDKNPHVDAEKLRAL